MRTLFFGTCAQKCNSDHLSPCQRADQFQFNPVCCAQHPWLRSQGIAADKPLDSVVLQRMRKLSATNKLKKAALVVMAKSLSAVRRHRVLASGSRSSAHSESRQRLRDSLSSGEAGHSIV